VAFIRCGSQFLVLHPALEPNKIPAPALAGRGAGKPPAGRPARSLDARFAHPLSASTPTTEPWESGGPAYIPVLNECPPPLISRCRALMFCVL
jgi:hypothetical protein